MARLQLRRLIYHAPMVILVVHSRLVSERSGFDSLWELKIGEIMTVKEYIDKWVKEWMKENPNPRNPDGTSRCKYPACVKPREHEGQHSM